jgi:hypothetical protein
MSEAGGDQQAPPVGEHLGLRTAPAPNPSAMAARVAPFLRTRLLYPDRFATRSRRRPGRASPRWSFAATQTEWSPFDRAMRAILATGRVQFLPLSDYEVTPDGSHHVVSRVTGRRLHVTVRRKLVDATYLENSIPATHRRAFEVGEGARCVPINALARLGAPSERYVVLGSSSSV